ncbi:MAG: alpha/beta hydrolase [Erythrobacter sp.]|uniref:alpha/beta fold hydrolase n=1 Tax=Erythrobacter sp. TaxID=1042 RepID=UPI003C7277D5
MTAVLPDVRSGEVQTSPTILLLPGNMCDERIWGKIALECAGATIAAPVPPGDTIDKMARHCLEHFPGPLIPIGFSMGGIVALAMADMEPRRIYGLGLIDTNPFADAPERAAQRPGQQRRIISGSLSDLVEDELLPNYLGAANRHDAQLRSIILAMAEKLGPAVFVAQSEALRTRPSYDHVLERLDVPVFVACGEEDRLCPPAAHESFAARIADAELHIIAGAGHMLPMEQPKILTSLLCRWLSETLMAEETEA